MDDWQPEPMYAGLQYLKNAGLPTSMYHFWGGLKYFLYFVKDKDVGNLSYTCESAEAIWYIVPSLIPTALAGRLPGIFCPHKM